MTCILNKFIQPALPVLGDDKCVAVERARIRRALIESDLEWNVTSMQTAIGADS